MTRRDYFTAALIVLGAVLNMSVTIACYLAQRGSP